jgi:hypothetical protein
MPRWSCRRGWTFSIARNKPLYLLSRCSYRVDRHPTSNTPLLPVIRLEAPSEVFEALLHWTDDFLVTPFRGAEVRIRVGRSVSQGANRQRVSTAQRINQSSGLAQQARPVAPLSRRQTANQPISVDRAKLTAHIIIHFYLSRSQFGHKIRWSLHSATQAILRGLRSPSPKYHQLKAGCHSNIRMTLSRCA